MAMPQSAFDLSGRTALVTGGGQGLGLALARGLSAAGADIILTGRSAAALREAAGSFPPDASRVSTAVFDVTDAAAVRREVDRLEESGVAIEILVNNAGVQRRGALEDFDHGDWRDVMATNVDGPLYVGQAVARHMIRRGRGKIINVGSVQCELARPSIAPYTASKGAVKNLTKGMCADWARYGLQINAIGPGYFATPLNRALHEDPEFDAWLRKRTPAGRWGKVEDLHGAAVFLASSASDFVNGQTIYVDGGMLAVL